MAPGPAPLPRLRFAHLPTPIEPLPRLGPALHGPALWIKRDDRPGWPSAQQDRKLEFLLAEAQAQAARTLVTAGSSSRPLPPDSGRRALRVQCVLVPSAVRRRPKLGTSSSIGS
jgi:hypothetical protein